MIPDQTKVKIASAAALPSRFTKGKVVGIYTTPLPVLGCIYAVEVDEIVSEVYPYKVVGVAELHLTPTDDL